MGIISFLYTIARLNVTKIILCGDLFRLLNVKADMIFSDAFSFCRPGLADVLITITALDYIMVYTAMVSISIFLLYFMIFLIFNI